jgi:hypothetical protein
MTSVAARSCRHPRETEGPGQPLAPLALLDSRVRGNDD